MKNFYSIDGLNFTNVAAARLHDKVCECQNNISHIKNIDNAYYIKTNADFLLLIEFLSYKNGKIVLNHHGDNMPIDFIGVNHYEKYNFESPDWYFVFENPFFIDTLSNKKQRFYKEIEKYDLAD